MYDYKEKDITNNKEYSLVFRYSVDKIYEERTCIGCENCSKKKEEEEKLMERLKNWQQLNTENK